jgi:hypothetical protein
MSSKLAHALGVIDADPKAGEWRFRGEFTGHVARVRQERGRLTLVVQVHDATLSENASRFFSRITARVIHGSAGETRG